MLKRLASHYGVSSRARKWQLYTRTFPPRRGEIVLDVGVSPHDDYPGENYFIHRYPYPEQLIAVGIVDLDPLRSRYPAVSFVHADGRDLPFEDDTFDVVHSNAVVEHVGPRPEQARFVEELVRVAKAGFITTPDRWFPFEVHTRVPFVHWLPHGAATWTLAHLGRFGRRNWGTWPLSANAFGDLFPQALVVEQLRQRIAGWPATTITLFWKRK